MSTTPSSASTYSTTSSTSSSSTTCSSLLYAGCSSGFWGDTPTAVPQLLEGGKLQVQCTALLCTALHFVPAQYLVADYLSEVTMSLLAAVKSKNPAAGFTPDFLESIAPHLGEIKRQGVRIVTNGGGINPAACVAMLQQLSKKVIANLVMKLPHGLKPGWR
jgi:hypothetical protein